MFILGICGYKKSGKDEVCNVLIRHLLPKSVLRVGFADALKEEVAKACGVTVQFIEDNKENFRLILQGYGTDFRRNLHGEDYWTLKLLHKLNKLPESTHLVIVPDVRFHNEASVIIAAGGVIWRVVRPTGDGHLDTHVSETNIMNLPFSEQIENSWNLEGLKRLVIDKWNKNYGQLYSTK